MSRHVPSPNILQAFTVGAIVSVFPSLIRLIGGGIDPGTALYQLVALVVLCGLSIAVIGVVFQRATRRGVALLPASFLALAATIPLTAALYLVEFALKRSYPELQVPLKPEPLTLGYTLATAFGDSMSISLFMSSLVFLPMFARVHEERNNELELVKREAALLRLRTHLEPHFVLNSLNAVAGLVEEDPAQARELLAALGDLFRDATGFQAVHRVRDEVAWLERYLTIHELRYPDSLHAVWDIDDATRDLVCPALILQPLVENAVKHGALRGGGHVTVRAHVDAQTLVLTVEDDGPGLGALRDGGRGLSIVRRRLELETLRPESFTLRREHERTVASVRLPVRTGAPDA
ncbi:sensor histidine kinase [Chondromyces crocatus]|uniref:Histidine kinase/HSP90-like ATPase domain-containing protein n=1 Tax=Chondromyces crocatus TaxID=52 RepID=A0A0K1EKF4_CHOCO|nr:histidine kinase [Chondromyces crocatus]AKT41349.1 uncharacterized protein CMC5_055480 [Chondromyces crocatus]